MDLLTQVQRALADLDAYSTPALNQLNQACGKDSCRRRERIVYQLQRYAANHSIPMGASSTTHRFKRDFATQKANIEVGGVTKAVTASNLTDEDVPLLRQYGYGHFLEKLPEPEPEAPDLHKLKKDELQAKYTEALGSEPDDKLTKEELIKAIEAGPKKD